MQAVLKSQGRTSLEPGDGLVVLLLASEWAALILHTCDPSPVLGRRPAPICRSETPFDHEIDQQLGENALEKDGPWHPAGPDWQAGQRLDRVTGIKAAEIQCDDPEMVARKWAEIAETDLDLSDGTFVLAMENADVRFVPCMDTRPEGLGGIDLEVVDRDAILAAAEKRGKISGENQVYLCGMRMNV